MAESWTFRRRNAGAVLVGAEPDLVWIQQEARYTFSIEPGALGEWMIFVGVKHAPPGDWIAYRRDGPGPSGCDFLVDAARKRVVVDHVSDVWRPLYALRMLRNIARWQLFHQGAVFLHASAVLTNAGGVALIGPPRCGKSSLMASALMQGHGFVSEDDLMLMPTPDGIVALGWPGSLRVRRSRVAACAGLEVLLDQLQHPANIMEADLDPDVGMVRILPSEIEAVFGVSIVAETALSGIACPMWGEPTPSTALPQGELTKRLLSAWDVLPERRAGVRASRDEARWSAQTFDPFFLDVFGVPELSPSIQLLREVGSRVSGQFCPHRGVFPQDFKSVERNVVAPTPSSDDEQEIRRLMGIANDGLDAVLAREVLNKTTLIADGGLSRTSLYRWLDAKKAGTYASVEEWLVDLDRIFGALAKTLRNNGRTPATWDEVFGNVPQPRNPRNPRTFNRARIRTEPIRKAAGPLIDELKWAYEQSKGHDNHWKTGQLLAHLCSLLELTEDWRTAKRFLKLLALSNRRTNDFHFEADAHLRRGIAEYFLGEFDEAAISIDKGLDIIGAHDAKSPPLRTKLRLLNYKATILAERDQAAALALLRGDCLPLAERSASRAAVASVHNKIGQTLLRQGDARDALVSLVEALCLRVDLGMKSEASRTLYVMGEAYRTLASPAAAIVVLEIAAALQVSTDDIDVLGLSRLACGRAFMDLAGSRFPVRLDLSLSLFPARELQATLQKLTEMLEIDDLQIKDGSAALREAETRLRAALHYGDERVHDEAAACLREIEQRRA